MDINILGNALVCSTSDFLLIGKNLRVICHVYY